MKVGVYSRPDGTGPLVLVAVCLRPSIEAEHVYGELIFQGAIDTDELGPGIDWARLLTCVLDASYTVVDRARAAPILAVMDVQAEPGEAPPRTVAHPADLGHPGGRAGGRPGEPGMGLAAAGLPTAYLPTHKSP